MTESKENNLEPTNTDELNKTVHSLYRIDKHDRLHFGWVCLRSTIWKQLPSDLSYFISLFLSLEPKLMLFMHKTFSIPTNNSSDCSHLIWQLILSSFWHQMRYSYSINYILYENKQYYQRSNTYYKRPSDLKNKYEHDQDIECDWGDTKCKGSWEIKPINSDDIIYIYNGDVSNDKLRFADIDQHYHLRTTKTKLEINGMYIFNELCKIASKFKLKNVFIGEEYNRKYDICFVNPDGINDDHRGADHCKIHLPFHGTQLIKKNQTVSFRNLVDIYFKSKSHKFDFWYELYSDCRVKMCHSTYDEQNSYMEITFSYDHGS
eukprot:348254_1